MTNTLDANGLSMETRSEILAKFQSSWRERYGTDINIDSNTSDGQLIEILTQFCTDYNETITDVYNSFSPNKCAGIVQDERYALNGIFRKTGSYTLQPIKITVNKTVTLSGIDDSDSSGAYTIQSDDGQQWYLQDTTTITTAESPITLSFRAKEKGLVQPTIGTITSQVTVVQGVTSVINDVAPTSYGSSEGLDYDFMLRREQSVSNASQNNTTTIKGNLLALDGVTQCNVYQYIETRNGSGVLVNDANGVAPYTIWVIVDGGTTSEIANIIYDNNSNTMLKGSVSTTVLSASGQNITIKFDRPVAVPLYIKFDLQETVSGSSFSLSDIKNYIAENLTYKLGEYAESSEAVEIAREACLTLSGNGVPTNLKIATSVGTATPSVSGTGISSASVDINTWYEQIKTAGTYVFSFDGSDWSLSGQKIDLGDYGITVVGTPVNGDSVSVVYQTGSWSEFIASSSPQNQFVIDTSRIFITEINV